MRAKSYEFLFLLLAPLVLPMPSPAQQAASSAQKAAPADWREQYAYTMGVQAYIYAFPWAYMPDARYTRTAAINHEADRFDHIRKLEDASHLNGGAPNNDTLYSRAWVYLKDEPVILSVPAIPNRYYTMEIVDFMGDNFAYVGTRATGTKAGNYAIIGPGWKGTLPAGVTALPPSSTPWATILGRTFLKDKSDLQNVFAIQDQYKLTPLSQWGKSERTPPKGADVWLPINPKSDPLAEWKSINRAMLDVPPAASDAALIKSYATIGVGPGLNVDAQDASTKRGLARAAVDGRKIIAGAFAGAYLQKQVNGWNYPPAATGRPTPTGDWLMRAVQMLAGFVANDPIEATYLNVSTDGDGKPLSGSNRYVIHFDKGGQPKVQAFWSVTMYNPQYNLVANPIDRYSLGDRSGMSAGPDGSLTIYVQKDSPGSEKEANWLPAPEGMFFLIMRTYLPGDDIVKQIWQPPRITRVAQ
jgi:hypothetical protein